MHKTEIKTILVVLGILVSILLVVTGVIVFNPAKDGARTDEALKITNCFPKSCQNPVFSPYGEYLIFTRFENGYNKGPAEIVKINLETKQEEIIVRSEGDNVNVPFGSWIGSKIVFASEDGITTANDDGSDIQLHLKNANGIYYIEPVFNPSDTNKIILESVKDDIHQIKLLELDKNNRITDLTDSSFDDRLPSWSPDGKEILWQRTKIGEDNWQIIVADIVLKDGPRLENITTFTGGPDDTDNSWVWDGKFILSSRTDDGKIPNIFAISLKDKTFKRITQSEYEDGAPSSSPDGKYVAFESHKNKNEESPAEIWIIKNPFENQNILQSPKKK